MLWSKNFSKRLWRSGMNGWNTAASYCFGNSECKLFSREDYMSVHFSAEEMSGSSFSDLFR